MTFQKTLKMILASDIFQTFKKENPEAELITGFFVIDFFSNDNKRSIDYQAGEKIFTFSLRDDDSIKFEVDKMMETQEKLPTLEKIDPDIKFDLEDIKSAVQIRSLDEGISSKFSKIIAVLQKQEGKDQIWTLTCMLDGLIILHVIIDPETGEIIKFERKSMMDLIKKK